MSLCRGGLRPPGPPQAPPVTCEAETIFWKQKLENGFGPKCHRGNDAGGALGFGQKLDLGPGK